MLRRIWTTVNRPLPAWLTLSLFLGAAALAAPPVFNGSLKVISGASITDTNASSGQVVTTTTGGKFQYGTPNSTLQLSGAVLAVNPNLAITSLNAAGQVKSQPAANSNAQLQLTASGTGAAVGDFASSEPNNNLVFEDEASGIGSLVNIGEIYARTPNGNCGGQTIAHMDLITAGNASHPGGGVTFHTSDDSGSCTDAENLVLTADHHVYMPQDQFYYQGNTPASCTQFVPCGTVTWTFTTPFHNTAGATSQPDCTAATIRDDNSTSRAWVVNIQSISATAVTYNYTSLNGIASATTLEIWAECHPASY